MMLATEGAPSCSATACVSCTRYSRYRGLHLQKTAVQQQQRSDQRVRDSPLSECDRAAGEQQFGTAHQHRYHADSPIAACSGFMICRHNTTCARPTCIQSYSAQHLELISSVHP